MALKFYNTLTRKKEEFIPQDRLVKMYVCGVTLYDEMHLGHARALVVFDVIRRFLEYKGYRVKYITNFTDIDDKMINRAKSLGISIFELAEKYIKEYFHQTRLLGLKPAFSYPRATQHIKEIIKLIQILLKKGLAYEREGNVYFRVRKFSSYGKLSGKKLEEMLVGARVEVEEKKEDPLDFALWKKAKEGEPFWESPWGKGRPGWHIECSAMAMKYLGETLDIHGGGEDLIFPHHENEIAQSEGATEKPFVRYWIHNGLLITRKEKMSKSLGNVFTLGGALEKYHPEVIRFYLLQAHYRSPLEFRARGLEEAKASLERIYESLWRMEGEEGEGDPKKTRELEKLTLETERRFDEAMEDDFNLPLAFSTIFILIKRVNLLLKEKPSPSSRVLRKVANLIRKKGKILGVFQRRETLGERERKLIEFLLELRENLRKEKKWGLADLIRERLRTLGIEVEDTKDGWSWRIKI